jgi:hypothetical protein
MKSYYITGKIGRIIYDVISKLFYDVININDVISKVSYDVIHIYDVIRIYAYPYIYMALFRQLDTLLHNQSNGQI